jgi:hypothetical protein
MTAHANLSTRRRAAVAVCDRAVDASDAATLLAALGLDQSLRPVRRRVPHVAGCVCQSCRSLISTQNARAAAAADPSIVPHGTVNGYDRYKCRCDGCKGARSEYDARRRGAVR